MKEKILGNIAAVIAVILWGSAASITITLYQYFTATDIVLMEFLIGYIVFCIVQRKPVKAVKWKHEFMFFLLGGLGITGTMGCLNMAYNYAPSGVVNVLYSTSPLFAAVLYMIIRRKAYAGIRFWTGGIIAVAGCCMVALGSMVTGAKPLGIVFGCLCALAWALYLIVYDYLGKDSDYPINGIMRRMFFYGWLTTLAILPFTGTQISLDKIFQLNVLPLLLFQGIFMGALSYLLWNTGCRIIGATQAAIYMYGMPFVTLVVSGIVLSESITAVKVIGCVITVIGVILSQTDKRLKENKG